MGIYKQTTEEFKQKVLNKYGNKVEILGEYVGGTEPIDMLYHCEKHGKIYKTLNAKNILRQGFQPCVECDKEKKSNSSHNRETTKEGQYNKLKEYCIQRGGKLISKEWITAKTKYEVDCGNEHHLNFYSTGDTLLSKNIWCPYCSGRKGDFEQNLINIVKNKNGTLLGKYEKSCKAIEVKCNAHEYIWEITYANLKKGRWCPICSLPFSEKTVFDYLKDKGFNFKVQYKMENLIGKNNEFLRFDFAVFDDANNLIFLLEIDDQEHRSNSQHEKRIHIRESDNRKDKYCIDNNIKLFRIPIDTSKSKKGMKFRDYNWYYNYIDDYFFKNIK